MSSIPFSEAREHFTDVINEVAYAGKRIVLTRKGKEMVAIVPLEDLVTIEHLEDKIDILAARKAEEDIKTNGTITLSELRKELFQ